MATGGRIVRTAGVVIVALGVGGVGGWAVGHSAHDAAPVVAPSPTPTDRCTGWQGTHDELLSVRTDAYKLERHINALAPFTGSNRGAARALRAERLAHFASQVAILRTRLAAFQVDPAFRNLTEIKALFAEGFQKLELGLEEGSTALFTFTSTSGAYVLVREGYDLIGRAGIALNTAFCPT